MKSITFSVLVLCVIATAVSAAPKTRNQSKKNELQCKCMARVSNKNTWVVNGKDTHEERYPWQVTLYSSKHNNSFAVGSGTILNEEWILTAASVLPDQEHKDRLKEVRVELPGVEELRAVKKMIVNRLYDRLPFSAKHDTALIKLKSKIDFGKMKTVQPACLDLNITHQYENMLSFAGYGSTKPVTVNTTTGEILNFVPSKTLKEGFVKDLTHEADECKDDTNDFICLEDKEHMSAYCLGDGGSPLHHSVGKYHYVVGFAGMPVGKEEEGKDSVTLCNNVSKAVRLSTYSSWLNFEMPKNSYVCTGPSQMMKMLGNEE